MPRELDPLGIPLPRRLDRRMRLGPFPSARDAIKFAGYAAIGTAALPVGGALAWLPFLAGGFFLAVYRPDGKGLDERAGDYLRWQFRRRRHRGTPRSPPGAAGAEGFVRLPGPFVAAILEAGGVPTRFLPPADARELFDRYRELLRSLDPGFHVDARVVPIRRADFRLPEARHLAGLEGTARDGYREMVELLLKRRHRRRVLFAVFEPLRAAASVDRLEARADAVEAHLAAMGTEPQRLRGSALERAAEEIGWPRGGAA